jgi:hypothetical protein
MVRSVTIARPAFDAASPASALPTWRSGCALLPVTNPQPVRAEYAPGIPKKRVFG